MPLFLEKLDKVMDKIECYCVGYATIIMTLIMFINVVLRNFFHSGLVWGNELSSYLNILAVFVVISAGFKHGSHVGVDAFVRILPKKIKKAVNIVTKICILIFCVLVSYLSIKMVIAQTNQVSPVLNIPLSLIYGFMVIGMIMSSIRVIMEIVKDITGDVEDLPGGDLEC